MKIAQVAPLHESVPPTLYGGTERVVSYLTEELVRAGHEVVLFASGDSRTSATLFPVCMNSLRLDPDCFDPVAHHFLLMETVLKCADEFDIIHAHVDYYGFSIGRRTDIPLISTVHGRLDLAEINSIFREFGEIPLISISNSQRLPVPWANWLETVYHGIPGDLYSLTDGSGEYLVYVGRIAPEKKVDSAIAIALKSEIPIKIAAKVDRHDREYFERIIRPLLDHQLVEYVGEVTDREKNRLLGQALAFIHPIDWPEPFGLTMIEAMACGTPVLARQRGSIPEVIDHGITGFIFDRDEEAVSYIKNGLAGFSRRICREQFEKRFLAERMVQDYLRAYAAVLEGELLRERA